MILGNLSRVLLYLCLLTGAVFFVLQTFQEYSEYATSYTITQERMTWSDLPTFVLCWDTTLNSEREREVFEIIRSAKSGVFKKGSKNIVGWAPTASEKAPTPQTKQ